MLMCHKAGSAQGSRAAARSPDAFLFLRAVRERSAEDALHGASAEMRSAVAGPQGDAADACVAVKSWQPFTAHPLSGHSSRAANSMPAVRSGMGPDRSCLAAVAFAGLSIRNQPSHSSRCSLIPYFFLDYTYAVTACCTVSVCMHVITGLYGKRSDVVSPPRQPILGTYTSHLIQCEMVSWGAGHAAAGT